MDTKDTTAARYAYDPRRTALAAVVTAKADIDALIAQLTGISANHFGVDAELATWADAGSVHEIRRRLRAVVDFATGREA